MNRKAWLIVLLSVAFGAGVVSDQRLIEELRAATPAVAVPDSPAASGPQAEITLCRKIGRKSGRRIGIGSEFIMADKSRVQGLVDFQNFELDRVHAIHLVWLRPGGKELFRKYAEVVVGEQGEGRVATITWRDAEDLHKVKIDSQLMAGNGFTLESQLDISLRKQRDPGEYTFRVYLHRKLYLESKFSVAEA